MLQEVLEKKRKVALYTTCLSSLYINHSSKCSSGLFDIVRFSH
jgi:hypothetical protein